MTLVLDNTQEGSTLLHMLTVIIVGLVLQLTANASVAGTVDYLYICEITVGVSAPMELDELWMTLRYTQDKGIVLGGKTNVGCSPLAGFWRDRFRHKMKPNNRLIRYMGSSLLPTEVPRDVFKCEYIGVRPSPSDFKVTVDKATLGRYAQPKPHAKVTDVFCSGDVDGTSQQNTD